jgi:hypothetical protein
MEGTKASRLGRYVETTVGGERVHARPTRHSICRPPFTLYDTARGAVGRLDGVTTILPSTPLRSSSYRFLPSESRSTT